MMASLLFLRKIHPRTCSSNINFFQSLPRFLSSTHCKLQDKRTHTGQEWDTTDYRLVRFTTTPKQVNESFAIDLIHDIPPKEIAARHVWCDGGGGPLGHPKVYINLDPEGPQACGYCGLRFFQKKHH